MVLWVVRGLFVLLMASLMFFSFNQEGDAQFSGPQEFFIYRSTVLVGCAFVLVLGLSIDLLIRRKSVAALGGVFFGLLVGLVVGILFNHVLEFVYNVFRVDPDSGLGIAREPLGWGINMICCYLAISFIMESKDDFRFIIPYVEFSKQTKGVCPLILDTSVIIDGRISDIAGTKVLNAPLVIPRFILNELQGIADSADRLRRNRGRRGLDILNKMQTDPNIDLSIQDIALTASESKEPVDHRLVAAALKLGGRVMTNDYNLNKVASLRGVDVININDLANALKPVLLPGEPLGVKIVRPGDQAGQGVGYLEDGTMVVIDGGREFLNREVEAVVTSVLQTSAGRMIFGRYEGAPGGNGSERSHNSGKSHNTHKYSN